MASTRNRDEALRRLGAQTGWASSYDLQVSRQALEALERRGLVVARRGLGSIAFPATAIKWRLTSTGRTEAAEAMK